MVFHETVRTALQTIQRQKLKTAFSLVGVFVGVTFLIAVVSIIQGMNRYMVERFANTIVGANSFELRQHPSFVVGEMSAETWRAWLRRPAIADADAEYLRTRLRTPATLAKECEGWVALEYGARTANVQLVGTEASYFAIRHYEIAAGRAFSAQEVRSGHPVVVIGYDVAEKLLAGVDPIGKTVSIAGLPYRVVGVIARQGTLFGFSLDRFAVVPITAPARRRLCAPDVVGAVIVQTSGPAPMRSAMEETEALLRSRRQLRPREESNFYLQTSEAGLATWKKISRVLIVALPALVAISLVVAGVVIMNIMLMAVTERTHEIGIRKALGARRRDILGQFLVESATISTIGALFGIAAGALLALIVQAMTPLPAAIAPWSVAVGIVLGIAVGVVAGTYPASRAARLDPIAALRPD